MSIVIRVMYVLLAIACVMLCYVLIVWVLGLLGVSVPDQVLRIIMVIIGLLAALGALQGRFDNWWAAPPKV